MQRMYDLANWTLNGDALSEEDKKKYEWDFDNGNWAGYKPPIGWSEVSGACLAAAGAYPYRVAEGQGAARLYGVLQLVRRMLGQGHDPAKAPTVRGRDPGVCIGMYAHLSPSSFPPASALGIHV